MNWKLMLIFYFASIPFCFFLSLVFQWLCTKLEDNNALFIETVKDIFYDPKTSSYEWVNGIPDVIFAPVFAALTLVILIVMLISCPLKVLFKKVMK